MDLSTVKVPKKEAFEIITEMRKLLVDELKEGLDRESANVIVAEKLRSKKNILSPYADDVIRSLYVNPIEIEFRNAFGDEFTDAYIKAKNAIK